MPNGGRHARSRRTNRLTPTDNYHDNAQREDYRDYSDSYEDAPRKRSPARGEARDDRRRADEWGRRGSVPANRHDRWDDQESGPTDAAYNGHDDDEREWADDSRAWDAAPPPERWEDSDADWRPDRRRGDYASRSARGWSDRWRETTSHWGVRRTQWRETTRQWVAAQGKRFLGTRRARIVTAVVLGVMLLCGLGPTIAAYIQYDRARSGLQHFKNAQADLTYVAAHPFDTATIAKARGEFVAASQDFTQLGQVVDAIAGPAGGLPVVGSKLSGASRLLPMAIQGATAGILGCDALAILSQKLKDPLNPSANALTASDLAAISAKYTQIRAIVSNLLIQAKQLRPSDLQLDSRLAPALASLQTKEPQIQQLLDDGQVLLDLAPVLLGVDKPVSYLVEVLDSTELRAAGGFIGNYGLLTLTGGHMNGIHIQDVDLLDAPYRYGNKVIPIPPGYQWFADASPKWGFRDSNLEADFPTSAQYGEQLYKQEGGPGELQGVIAITPWMVQSALRITGPVDVPEFNERVNADNMVEQIHKYQLTNGLVKGPDDKTDPNSGTSQRKAFTGYLFQHFMAKVKEQSAQDMGKFVKLFMDSIHSKDVQIYLNAEKAETVLRHNHISGAIEAPQAGDSLLVADANIVASKINYYLQNTVHDQVTLDANGTATHTMTLTYVWPPDQSTVEKSFPAGYPYLYISWLRAYAPPNAQLLGQSRAQSQKPGWQGPVVSKQAFGRAEWGGKVYVPFGTTTNVTLTWSVPHAATQSGQMWQYSALIQRQAGYTYALDYSLALPSCAKRLGAPPSGFTTPAAQSLALKQPLTKDLSFTVTYTC
jgi:Protein of unknown function (DUF4012)